MNIRTLLTLARLPGLRAQLQLSADADAFVRLHFLYAAQHAGLLACLTAWRARDELSEQLSVRRPEVLDALLAMGVALGEFARAGDRYRIRGSRAAALAAASGDPAAAMLEEYVTYHAAVYRDLGEQLAGSAPIDYLEGRGALIARSSRALEPFIRDFTRDLVAGAGRLRLLEIGCGSGVYLRHAAQANPQAVGIGIDLQADVVRETAAALRDWGLDGRFRVLQADIRVPLDELRGPFDLITLYNNIYYFAVDERVALLRDLRTRLAPGGRLAVVSLFQASTIAAANFDLMLRATSGCAPLPRLDELAEQLRAAGFETARTSRLMPGQPLYAMVARC